MKQYLELLEKIQKKGTYKPAARENMPGTLSLFGEQMRFDLQEGFPMVTTKKVSFKNIIVELLWFLKGDTNIKYLVDNGCNIWNEDAYNYYVKKIKELDKSFYNSQGWIPMEFEEFVSLVKEGELESEIPNYKFGDCGKQYGWLWRRWENPFIEYGNYVANNAVDQLKDLIEGLKTNPMSRRHVITAWNPATLNDMALNACHAFVQFNCRKINYDYDKLRDLEIYKSNPTEAFEKIPHYYLDCQLYQRSADVVLGVPYNIASYALLTEIIAKICNMIPGEFVHTFGDVHIYENHLEGVAEQLEREPKVLPQLKVHYNLKNGFNNVGMQIFEDLSLNDFALENYESHPKLKAETKLSTGL